MGAPADRGFIRAIESRYLAFAAPRTGAGADAAAIQRDALAEAIYRADRTNGGVRYRALDAAVRGELERRLRAFVERRARTVS